MEIADSMACVRSLEIGCPLAGACSLENAARLACATRVGSARALAGAGCMETAPCMACVSTMGNERLLADVGRLGITTFMVCVRRLESDFGLAGVLTLGIPSGIACVCSRETVGRLAGITRAEHLGSVSSMALQTPVTISNQPPGLRDANPHGSVLQSFVTIPLQRLLHLCRKGHKLPFQVPQTLFQSQKSFGVTND